MKKMFVCGVAMLCLAGLSACGSNDDSKSSTEPDTDVVSPDAGTSQPDAGNLDKEDAGNPDKEDAGNPDKEDAGTGDESDYGVKCDENFQERCDGNVMVYCGNSKLYPGYGEVTAIDCGDEMKCGIVSGDHGVDCVLPCDKKGEEFNLCGAGDYEGYTTIWACDKLTDGTLGAYWSYELECKHGCDENSGECALLVPDEEKFCLTEKMEDSSVEVSVFEERCDTNKENSLAVYCKDQSVNVLNCTEYGMMCYKLKGENLADCYTEDQTCSTVGEKSPLQCYVDPETNKEYVVSYECMETETAGTAVWILDLGSLNDKSACSDHQSCISGDGTTNAHCGLLDDRIDTECTKEDFSKKLQCSEGNKGILQCKYVNGGLKWVLNANCEASGTTCVQYTKNDIDYTECLQRDPCKEGDASTQTCEHSELWGTELVYSVSKVCQKEEASGNWFWEEKTEFCEKSSCNESTGKCVE